VADSAALARAWMRAMRRGDFEAAWRLSDRRLAAPPDRGPVEQPRHLQSIWDGRAIAGRRVLVRCYHGLGDTIQFARFLPRLAARAASVVVWAPSKLLPLLRTLPAPIEWLALHDGAPDVAFDVDVELMELPWILRLTIDDVGDGVPYLHVEPGTPGDGAALNVGVMWRGGDWDAARSIPVEALAPLCAVDGVRVMALQGDPRPDERRGWPGGWAPSASMDELARTVAGLDLVISVDTMCAHLAGALGRPAWLLLKQRADWRWLERRRDTPWYPSMRLYRQARAGDWGAAIARVLADLQTCAWDFGDLGAWHRRRPRSFPRP
jgi:hypothetical protein